MKDIKHKHALGLARSDLCFAINYCCDYSAPYIVRLWGTVEYIVRTLDDKEKFLLDMKRWEMSCPGCRIENYLRKCALHNKESKDYIK